MAVSTLARAEFLKAAERSETATSSSLKARWGDAAGDTAQSSCLVDQSAAATEASRQLAFLGATFAYDRVVLEGVYFDLEGETVRVAYSMPGGGNYFGGAATVDILVTRASINLADGTTIIEGFVAL